MSSSCTFTDNKQYFWCFIQFIISIFFNFYHRICETKAHLSKYLFIYSIWILIHIKYICEDIGRMVPERISGPGSFFSLIVTPNNTQYSFEINKNLMPHYISPQVTPSKRKRKIIIKQYSYKYKSCSWTFTLRNIFFLLDFSQALILLVFVNLHILQIFF